MSWFVPQSQQPLWSGHKSTSGCSVPCLSFLLLCDVYGTCMWVHRFTPTCRHAESRVGCQVPSSIALCLIGLRHVLTDLEAGSASPLVGKLQVPVSTHPHCRAYSSVQPFWPFTWVLQIPCQSSYMLSKHSSSLNPSLSPLASQYAFKNSFANTRPKKKKKTVKIWLEFYEIPDPGNMMS